MIVSRKSQQKQVVILDFKLCGCYNFHCIRSSVTNFNFTQFYNDISSVGLVATETSNQECDLYILLFGQTSRTVTGHGIQQAHMKNY